MADPFATLSFLIRQKTRLKLVVGHFVLLAELQVILTP